MKYLQFILLVLCMTGKVLAVTAEQAEAVLKEHEILSGKWRNELAAARSMEQMQAIMAKKPDMNQFKKRMISVIGADLNKPWTLRYAGWLIANTNLGQKDLSFIMDYARKFHMKAPDLGRFCYDVVLSKQPLAIKKVFIEQAYQGIKQPKQKGLAAISLAAVLSEIGDVGMNNARRLSLIKEAIVSSSDEVLYDKKVSDVAMDMVYRLKNLSKGSRAPLFAGTDSAGSPLSLQQFQGKVVLLVFWSSYDLATEKTLDLLDLIRNIEKQYQGKQVVVLGVNRDQVSHLRELEKASLTSAKTITDPQQKIFQQYRVAVSPHCFVIDQVGKVRYSGPMGSFATLTVDALLNPRKK